MIIIYCLLAKMSSITVVIIGINDDHGLYAGSYAYKYSSRGVENFVDLGSGGLAASELLYGDFNGDGFIDLLSVNQIGSTSDTYPWEVRWSGAGAPETINQNSFSRQDLQLGDFNNDGLTDVFATQSAAPGRLEWLYWPGGKGQPAKPNTVDGPEPLLGNFTGDARTDALIIRCAEPARFRIYDQFEVPDSDKNLFGYFVGQAKADNHNDLIRFSQCQDYDADNGECKSYHPVMGVLAGDGQGGLTSQGLQTLSQITLRWDTYDYFPADANGDSFFDLLWVRGGVADGETIYVSLSDGQGGYSLGPAQDFGDLGYYNAGVGDFNGDGRTDVVYTLMCLNHDGFRTTGCTGGQDHSNKVALALSSGNGSYSLGTVQTLSTLNWYYYDGYVGDVNGDGRDDLIWNSICQGFDGDTCTLGDGNYVYVALSDGLGGFELSPQQTYGASGWGDSYRTYVLDVTGDDLDDLVWLRICPDNPNYWCLGGGTLTARVGIATGNGTFSVTPSQDLGFNYWEYFRALPGDVNGDGAQDIVVDRISGGQSPSKSLVYTILGAADGQLSLAPMEQMPGRYLGFLRVGDLTGDQQDELIWIDPATNIVTTVLNGSDAGPGGPDWLVFLPLVSR